MNPQEWVSEWRNGKAWPWLYRYNTCAVPDREAILKENLNEIGTGCAIRAPFFCELGDNIYLGNDVFINFNCVFLDVARIQIGDKTMFGPGVQIYTATHSTDPDQRVTLAEAVFIGEKVWVGGGAIILPGVQIGDGATVGAGSVVTKNVPAGAVVMGNPARIK